MQVHARKFRYTERDERLAAQKLECPAAWRYVVYFYLISCFIKRFIKNFQQYVGHQIGITRMG